MKKFFLRNYPVEQKRTNALVIESELTARCMIDVIREIGDTAETKVIK